MAFLFERSTPLPGVVRGDEQRLRQVLLNLLSNAVKFTERGGVVLRAGYSDPDGEGNRLRFSVEDTGPGIAPEERPPSLNPFTNSTGRIGVWKEPAWGSPSARSSSG